MKNEKELKYAALMAKAYNWLNEFSRGKGNEGLGFGVSQRGNYLFQGRGDNASPKTSFYVEIGKRPENYIYLTLDFYVKDDFSQITKVNAHMGWQEQTDAYKTLAQQLSNNVGNQKSATIQIVESANEDKVKQGLQNWLSEHCVQIVTAYGQNRRPEDKVRADRLTQLKNNGFLSVGEDGIVSIPQTADFVTRK